MLKDHNQIDLSKKTKNNTAPYSIQNIKLGIKHYGNIVSVLNEISFANIKKTWFVYGEKITNYFQEYLKEELNLFYFKMLYFEFFQNTETNFEGFLILSTYNLFTILKHKLKTIFARS